MSDIDGGPKINIQIDPDVQAKALAVTEGTEEPYIGDDLAAIAPNSMVSKTPADLQDWFWTDIGTGLDQASADRMWLAALQMAKAPDQYYQPRAQHLNEIAGKFGSHILRATISTKVSPALVLAVIGVESSGRTDATSTAGAKGLMQLIPETAARFGVKDIKDPAQNIAGGVAYLDWLLNEFSGDPLLALAAYNAGENAVKKNNGVPAYPETRNYVPKVVAAWQVARNLCASPPMLVSEPCVFKIQALKAKQ